MIHRLHAGGVRVPVPYHYIDGVLVMELITDGDGNPAPRLGDVALDRDAGFAIYDKLVREVVRMLCAGVVHGDLSEFNVLLSGDGPVIIDFPQSIDSAHNTNARRLLVRDVDNIHRFIRRVAPGARTPPYAQEMWNLYEQNLLTPETRLRGDYRPPVQRDNTASVLELIDDANRDERKRRDALGLRGGPRPAPAPAAPAKRKDPPVYQGLPNQGLSSFRGNRFARNDGQRGQAPRHDGQRTQETGSHPQRGRPGGSHPQQGRPGGVVIRNRVDLEAVRRNRVDLEASPSAGRPPARPEVERIHVRPRDPQRKDAPPPREPVAPAPGRHERREEQARNTPSASVRPPTEQGAQPQRRRVIRSGHTPDRPNGTGGAKSG